MSSFPQSLIRFITLFSVLSDWTNADKLFNLQIYAKNQPTLYQISNHLLVGPKSTQMTNSPYSKECPRKDDMSSWEIDENNLCILRQKWYKEVPTADRGDKIGNMRTSSNFIFDPDKIERWTPAIPANVNETNEDCLENERGKEKDVPTECYLSQEAIDPDANNALRENKVQVPIIQDKWWRIWDKIYADFAYTFDFVLPNIDNKDHFYWYIWYLKTFVSLFKHPADILNIFHYQKELADMHNQLYLLLEEYASHARGVAEMGHTLNDLKTQMYALKADKDVFISRLNKIRAELGYYDLDKTVMDKKVDVMNIKMRLIKNNLDRGSALQHYYPVYVGMPRPYWYG